MSSDSDSTLVDAIRETQLLLPAQIDELSGQFTESRGLARELIQRGWLTTFQINQLLQGKGKDLVLGSYLLLERIGAGGMGQVYKARHGKLGRMAAIKIIRKERLQNVSAMKRFRREIQVIAKLSHPNVVLAYDANEANGLQFLVTEFVDGIDLAKLVKEKGAVSVEQACDFMYQAALGLQHAHDHGLVHRDIKPSNLLLSTQDSKIKLLDLGLALLKDDSNVSKNDSMANLTLEGTFVGTVDYLSPEQALDSHHVDIRSYLYSLGCTFYFLLTGQAPFHTGLAAQRMLKHRLEEPESLEKLRPDVPPGIRAIVRKLMDKRPKHRFQTPRELAEALIDGGKKIPDSIPQPPPLPSTWPVSSALSQGWKLWAIVSVVAFFAALTLGVLLLR